MGVVRSIATVEARLEDRVKTCMFLGYAKNCTGGTYRMLNIRTKRIGLSCDVIRMNKTYGKCVSRKENTNPDFISYKMKTSTINGLT